MNRKEIVEQLDSIVGTYEILMGNGINSDILDVDDIVAIREAIKILSAEPCEDCISREAAINEFEDCSTQIWSDDTIKRLRSLPSVQPVSLDVIEEIKAEVFRQSKQTNERFSHDWNEGFNDGMFHTLTIIRECFNHISGKEN